MAIDFEQSVRVAVDILSEFEPVDVLAMQEKEGAYLLEKSPNELIERAGESVFYDGAARRAVADKLEQGDALPHGVGRWAGSVIRGEAKKPKSKPGRVIDERLASQIGVAILTLAVNGTVPTRAESSDQRSGCDAVSKALWHIHENPPQNFDAEALHQIRKMSKSFESVRRVWHDFQKRSGLAGTE